MKNISRLRSRPLAAAGLLGLLPLSLVRADGPLHIPVPKGTNLTYSSVGTPSYNFALVGKGRRAGVSLSQVDRCESFAALANLHNEGLTTEDGSKPAIPVHPEKLESKSIRGEALLLPDKEDCLVHFSFKAGPHAWKGIFGGSRDQWHSVRALLLRIEPTD